MKIVVIGGSGLIGTKLSRCFVSAVIARYLRATGDARNVITDPHARYFGTELNDQSLTPGDNPRLGTTRFDEWLSRSAPSH